ncbi:MAG: histidine triad nucleotide-binding protein [Oscillospiraceae bacterium]|jgi:histidine triad (HIT) family protein|nr:histidine triad nucleotide-binding protein [Oscillospiraceae bacterium]MBR7011240.1 histidine triad nucleotide-binding protein [Oscillospiraceae bacterium]
MNDCIFCKIINGDIPSKKVYEDELCFAFYDIAPLAPTHFLVVPKQHIASAAEITEENASLVGHIYTVIAKLAAELGFAEGFRVVTNCGADAGQTVHHLHFHVLAGRTLGSFN